MKRLLLVLTMLLLASSACQMFPAPTVAEAAAAEPTLLHPTDTPAPSPTATLSPTATPNATATMAVSSTQTAVPVLGELKKILVDSDIPYEKGHLAWENTDPIDITLEQRGGSYAKIEGTQAANFILKSDVTWNATGIVLCGAAFRSGKILEQGTQYRFLFLRLAGSPGWQIVFFDSGQRKSIITGKTRFASSLDLANGATNQFVLIAQENKFTVYLNGVRQGQFTDDSKQASNGYLAFLALNDSGQASCSYKNSWLWILDS